MTSPPHLGLSLPALAWWMTSPQSQSMISLNEKQHRSRVHQGAWWKSSLSLSLVVSQPQDEMVAEMVPLGSGRVGIQLRRPCYARLALPTTVHSPSTNWRGASKRLVCVSPQSCVPSQRPDVCQVAVRLGVKSLEVLPVEWEIVIASTQVRH